MEFFKVVDGGISGFKYVAAFIFFIINLQAVPYAG